VDPAHPSLSVKRQCELLGLPRSSYYCEPTGESRENLDLMNRIDRIYTACPFYGSRRIRDELWRQGIEVGRGRVIRLMRLMGIEGKLPGRRTTRPAPGHKVYPNRLRDRRVERAGEVWATDITYLPMRHGTMYLVAVMDWYSRAILAWEISNSLDTDFCLRVLDEALERHEAPEIFHSDQGCQFTSTAFTARLKEHGIAISMAGRPPSL